MNRYFVILIVEWVPDLSGCYRPMYYFNPQSRGTENNLVRPLEPVIIMVSEKAYDSLDPGYDSGKYTVSLEMR